ncbi:MAG: DNA polymerase IV [Lachnospiraceae bacterium]|nr:DNA polymerase IV [Lachnospiraceae bacterium]
MNTTSLKPLIFHIDVNSAFLSWEAFYRTNILGEVVDLREIPSAIGGDKKSRHGIILAKSTPAKKYGIETAEPIVSALKKCPNLTIVPPNHDLYVKCSNEFMELLRVYAPVVEQYSIDEAFLDMTGTSKLYNDPIAFAYELKNEIKTKLGFTVNIGISENKLLAKMASDFEKPDKVHTLFPAEIETKLWPLPIGDLFFVGPSTAKKLIDLGIYTIGDLANTDINLIKAHFKKHGEVIWNYANGRDTMDIRKNHFANKGYSHDITLPYDVMDADTAKHFLLAICETLGARIRADKAYIGVVAVTILDNEFNQSSKQISLPSSTDVTEKIYMEACKLFDTLWTGQPIRLLSVHTSKATSQEYQQINMFDTEQYEKFSKLNSAIDSIRNKYGDKSIQRASLMESRRKE